MKKVHNESVITTILWLQNDNYPNLIIKKLNKKNKNNDDGEGDVRKKT